MSVMTHSHICHRWVLHPYLLCQVLFLELLRQVDVWLDIVMDLVMDMIVDKMVDMVWIW